MSGERKDGGMAKFWTIEGAEFEFDSILGNRELTVFGRPGIVGISVDPDDDRQAVQLTMTPDEWRQVAEEILRVCDLAGSRMEAAAG